MDASPPGVTYNYWLEAVPLHGAPEEYGPVAATSGDGRLRSFALAQSYPNPARGETTIAFALPEACDVRLTVYDLAGRLVATPASGLYEARSRGRSPPTARRCRRASISIRSAPAPSRPPASSSSRSNYGYLNQTAPPEGRFFRPARYRLTY